MSHKRSHRSSFLQPLAGASGRCRCFGDWIVVGVGAGFWCARTAGASASIASWSAPALRSESRSGELGAVIRRPTKAGSITAITSARTGAVAPRA